MKPAILIALLLGIVRCAFAGDLQILYPLYNYPDWYSPSTYIWKTIADENSLVPITAIINPDNGPGGAGPNTDYQQGMADLEAGGVKMIGYVATGYGTRSLSAVEADIDLYASSYAGVTGIFLDEESNDPSMLSYYQTLDSYIRTKPGLTDIVANPGTNAPESYVSGTTANTTVLIESGTGWNGYLTDSYVGNYPRSDFAAIFYNLSTASEMESAINMAQQENFGYVFATDGTGANPYDTLPGYWTTEASYVASIPEPNPTPLIVGGAALLAAFFTHRAQRRRRGVTR